MSRSFLIVLPKRDAVGVGAGRERHLDLGDRGGVEARAERGEQRQHLRRRVRLHGVEHARVGQRLGEGLVVVAHDVEVDDEAAARRRSVAAQEVADARGHGALLHPRLSARRGRGLSVTPGVSGDVRAAVRWRHGRDGLSPGDAALDWSGRTRSARPARMDKPLRCRPLEGRRDQRSPLRRCFKPRPPLRAGCAGFASGCRSSSEEADPSSGGCPASCPDTYRPTRGHRHVRIWATRE